jgi:hypothetical protein|tara:strand:- start:2982 stop:3260 length:279 start_codon:yes stop_codon:yes gene_type:complete
MKNFKMEKEKRIKIEISYIDNFEKSGRSVLLDILTQISEDILEKNLIYNSGYIPKTKKIGSTYKYCFYRIEKINDKLCYVYPSKLDSCNHNF